MFSSWIIFLSWRNYSQLWFNWNRIPIYLYIYIYIYIYLYIKSSSFKISFLILIKKFHAGMHQMFRQLFLSWIDGPLINWWVSNYLYLTMKLGTAFLFLKHLSFAVWESTSNILLRRRQAIYVQWNRTIFILEKKTMIAMQPTKIQIKGKG